MTLLNKVRNLAIASMVMVSSLSNAAIIEFDDYATSFTNFSFRNIENVLPGIDLRIEAAIFSNSSSLITNIMSGSDEDRRFGFLDDDGLGVINTLGADDSDPDNNIDGTSSNDLIILTFSRPVAISSISFSNFGSLADFEFGLIEGDFFNRIITDEDVESNVTFASLVGTTFGIGAVRNNDSFRVDNITAVSSPGLAFLFGFACLTFIARRLAK